MEDLTVVIRSVGERTEQACLEIVHSQVAADNQIHCVKNKPFSDAHVESLHLAVQSQAKWALFLDADVLLHENALAMMLREAENISQAFFMLNFPVLDRGFDGPAYAGVHLYSAKHLRTALLLSEVVEGAQRPENRLCVEMAHKAKIPSLGSSKVAGLHGYEQFYTDLYRTTFVRAVKWANLTDYLLWLYRSRYESASDDKNEYRVMLWGLLDGIVYRGMHSQAPLNKPFYQTKATTIMTLLGLREKEQFLLNAYPVESVISKHSPNPRYREIATLICSSGEQIAVPPRRSFLWRIRRIFFALRRQIKHGTRPAIPK